MKHIFRVIKGFSEIVFYLIMMSGIVFIVEQMSSSVAQYGKWTVIAIFVLIVSYVLGSRND